MDTLITVDTDDLITAGKLQSSCQDLRFTNTNGKHLPYYIDSGCNGNSTKVWVRADLVPKNTTKYTMYMYYGNPTAVAGTDSTTFNLYNGLKGYWTQNESSWNGTSGEVKDSSINGSNGTANGGVTTTTGQYGNAGDFQGTNDDVSIATESNYDFENTDSFSVASWVKPNVTRSGGLFGYQIFSKLDSTSPFPGWEFELLWDGSSKTVLRPLLINSSPTNVLDVRGTTDIPNSSWVHVAFTYNGTSNASGVKMYINGVLETTTTSSNTLSASILNNITPRIGSRNNVNSFFIGQIDDTRVYRRVLSDDEVGQLYSNPGSITTTATATSQPSTAFASEEKGPSPVAYWKFDDGTGTAANDSTSNNLDGTITEATWQTEDLCVAGKCLLFDGSNDEVTVADNAALDFTGDFTLSAWAKANTLANNFIISKTNASDNLGGYGMLVGANGEVYCRTAHGSGYDDSSTALGVVTTNQWYNLTVVRSGTSCKVYVNGQDRTNTADTHTTMTANSHAVKIGTRPDEGGEFWDGFIDEPKIYNFALTEAQIEANYNARSGNEGASQVLGALNQPNALSNGLVGYWKMDESSWATDCATESVLDSSGNSNTGGGR